MGRDYPEVSGSREGRAAGPQPCCLHRPRWPNSRLQRDLTKLDNPKGRVPHLALPAGSCPYPHPHPLPLSVSVSLFSSVFLSLYGLCFLVFHSDKCNMMGRGIQMPRRASRASRARRPRTHTYLI